MVFFHLPRKCKTDKFLIQACRNFNHSTPPISFLTVTTCNQHPKVWPRPKNSWIFVTELWRTLEFNINWTWLTVVNTCAVRENQKRKLVFTRNTDRNYFKRIIVISGIFPESFCNYTKNLPSTGQAVHNIMVEVYNFLAKSDFTESLRSFLKPDYSLVNGIHLRLRILFWQNRLGVIMSGKVRNRG